MSTTIEGSLNGVGLRVAVAVSRWNEFVTSRLLDGALDCLRMHGVADEEISVVRCPGAFELPLVVKRLAESGRFDAIVALGAVIRGATPHFDYVAGNAANGIAQIALASGIPCGFGLLTTDTVDQAIERAGSKSGNKGWEAAATAIEMVNLLRSIDGNS